MQRFNRFFNRLGIYRNVQDGWITGLCAGIAGRLGVRPIWVRLAFVAITAVMHSILPVIVYLVLAFLIKPRNAAGSSSPAGVQMAYRDLAESVAPTGAAGRRVADLQGRFTALDARLNNLEAAAMSDEISLRRKFRDIGG